MIVFCGLSFSVTDCVYAFVYWQITRDVTAMIVNGRGRVLVTTQGRGTVRRPRDESVRSNEGNGIGSALTRLMRTASAGAKTGNVMTGQVLVVKKMVLGAKRILEGSTVVKTVGYSPMIKDEVPATAGMTIQGTRRTRGRRKRNPHGWKPMCHHPLRPLAFLEAKVERER